MAKVVVLRIFVTFTEAEEDSRKIMNDLIEGRRWGKRKKLGEYLYEHLENNEYLSKLMDDLSLQYAFWIFSGTCKLTSKQKNDLLRFADLLVKSISDRENNEQKKYSIEDSCDAVKDVS